MLPDVIHNWQSYKQKKDDLSREALVKHYQPLVNYVARGFNGHSSRVLEFCDLVSAGMMGLLEAIDRFDPAKEIKFETFAVLRIRGAILDSLRHIDWAPRLTRKKVKSAIKNISELQDSLGRNPTELEISDKLGISLEEYRKILHCMNSMRIVSLQDVIYIDENSEVTREQSINNRVQDDFYDPHSSKNLTEDLAAILQRLPAKERLVLTLYYYEGLNLLEISEILDVSESRVSQLHAQSLMRIKSQFLKIDTGVVDY